MQPLRRLLLAASENEWMRANAARLPVFRKAVTRFMPGESLEDAVAAAAVLRQQHGIATVLTRLGENVTQTGAVTAVAAHYHEASDRLAQDDPDGQLSIKLTQLGLDIDPSCCRAHVTSLAERAGRHGAMLWIDMEQYRYVEATLAVYHAVLATHPNVGICLQAYLHRTADDLRAVIAARGAVRLVKGAYREQRDVAHTKKVDVDASYLALARTMVDSAGDANGKGARTVFGTHDVTIIDAIQRHAGAAGLPPDGYEFALLYGIQRGVQQHLARSGFRVRVLISYGDYWFPWYMRRLAERPANVWFVARSLFAR